MREPKSAHRKELREKLISVKTSTNEFFSCGMRTIRDREGSLEWNEKGKEARGGVEMGKECKQRS